METLLGGPGQFKMREEESNSNPHTSVCLTTLSFLKVRIRKRFVQTSDFLKAKEVVISQVSTAIFCV